MYSDIIGKKRKLQSLKDSIETIKPTVIDLVETYISKKNVNYVLKCITLNTETKGGGIILGVNSN